MTVSQTNGIVLFKTHLLLNHVDFIENTLLFLNSKNRYNCFVSNKEQDSKIQEHFIQSV